VIEASDIPFPGPTKVPVRPRFGKCEDKIIFILNPLVAIKNGESISKRNNSVGCGPNFKTREGK
jgi:hypothetical protein